MNTTHVQRSTWRRPRIERRSWRAPLLWLVAIVAFVVAISLSPEGWVAAGAEPAAQALGSTPTIRIGVLKDGAHEVVTLPLEVYVARVLPGEALPGSAPAAMEALAIAVRTYTLGNLGKHGADGFDLCDQTHCQVMRAATPASEDAALATANQVLRHNNATATVYYSASCGGRTEKPSNVWPTAANPSYLPSQPDDGCGGAPQWSTELGLADLQRALNSTGFRGTLTNVRIASRNESGRAQQLALDGLTPSQISGQDLRMAVGRTLGWQYIQSTNFELTRSGAAIRLRGHGAGHGVGMCVIGSSKLATAGKTAAQILGQYFPGTTIERVAPQLMPPAPQSTSIAPTAPNRAATLRPSGAGGTALSDIVVSLPPRDQSEGPAVAALIGRERSVLATALAVPPLSGLSVRFHATTDAYQQATGTPWYTMAATLNGELHFVPLTVLKERGVLERTIRHQLVHVMMDDALAGRPAWVREGAAIHFAEGVNGPPQRQPCPVDNELVRPTSVGALSDAYARARACFERQLSAGRRVTDIR